MEAFVVKSYGVERLIAWTKDKFMLDVTSEEINSAIKSEDRRPADVIMAKAADLYLKREIEYPVDFVMELTMMMMRQSPQEAGEQLVGWANRRFGFDWSFESLKTTPPQKIREQLLEGSKKFVEEKQLERAIDAALACPNDTALEARPPSATASA